MMSYTVAVSDLQFVGHGLARPECVVATARGDVFVSDRRGGLMHLMRGGGQRLIAARGVDGFLPNGFSLLPDRSFAVANIGGRGGAWRLLPDGELIPEVIEVEGMALPPTNFVFAEAPDAGLRLWVSVSTRHVPREQAFRRDIADGYIVLKDGTDVRIVADGLGFTNETKVDPSGRWLYVNETMARRLSRFALRERGGLGPREPSPSSTTASSPTASSSTPRAASGSRAWSAIACCASRPMAARRSSSKMPIRRRWRGPSATTPRTA
jgi:hypothetical protein